jgi:uncharacterized membrane protein
MELNDIFLFFHILSAIVWLGTGFAVEFFSLYMSRNADKAEMYKAVSLYEWLGLRVFMPSGILTIVFGVLLVAFGRPTFGQLWIVLAILGVIASMVIGGAFIGKLSGKINLLVKKGAGKKTIEKLYSKLTFMSRIDLAILLFILFDMVVKPKGWDTTFFGISLIFFAAVITFSYLRLNPSR